LGGFSTRLFVANIKVFHIIGNTKKTATLTDSPKPPFQTGAKREPEL
jgi:hypothetical protein